MTTTNHSDGESHMIKLNSSQAAFALKASWNEEAALSFTQTLNTIMVTHYFFHKNEININLTTLNVT